MEGSDMTKADVSVPTAAQVAKVKAEISSVLSAVIAGAFTTEEADKKFQDIVNYVNRNGENDQVRASFTQEKLEDK